MCCGRCRVALADESSAKDSIASRTRDIGGSVAREIAAYPGRVFRPGRRVAVTHLVGYALELGPRFVEQSGTCLGQLRLSSSYSSV